MNDIGLIIPCYNEEKRLDVNAFSQFIQSNTNYHLCFVNDGSKDGTLKILNKIKEHATEQVSILDIEKNTGKASAVRTGALYLFKNRRIATIGFIDADLSTDFDDLKKLVNTLQSNEELSFVYGSRGYKETKIEQNIFRKFCAKIIKMIVHLILRLPIKDTQCGAKVFKREIIPVVYRYIFLTRWLFDIEIFIRMKQHFGAKEIMKKIHEQPLEKWIHADDTKITLKDSLLIPYKLIVIWFSYKFNQTQSTMKVS